MIFIIYNMIPISLSPILLMHYTFKAFMLNINCIVYDLCVLEVMWKIQIMNSLQADERFVIGS